MEVLGDDGEMEGLLGEDEDPVISQWLAINSTEQLDQFMVSQISCDLVGLGSKSILIIGCLPYFF